MDLLLSLEEVHNELLFNIKSVFFNRKTSYMDLGDS